MMTKIKYGVALLVTLLIVTVSCKKDDENGPDVVPPHDRGEEAAIAKAEFKDFLATHFYNYTEFENDPENFKLRFDTIPKGNTDIIPLKMQVDSIKVTDLVDKSVEYTLYILKVREGGGEKPHFSDYTTNTYDGRLLNLDLFDSAVTPVRFNLVDSNTSAGIIRGLQQAMIQFRGATNVMSNPDGTLTFENYGIGAVFVPSGLAYFQYPPVGNLKAYEQLIFSFELFGVEVADHDDDGIDSYLEDLNGNGYLFDDDTDGNGVPNYLDTDDDGDGRLTKDEIEIINGVVNYPDKNGNGTPDYLDPTI